MESITYIENETKTRSKLPDWKKRMKNAYFEIEIINYFVSIRRRLLSIPHFLSVLETTENNRLSPVIKSTTFVCDSCLPSHTSCASFSTINTFWRARFKLRWGKQKQFRGALHGIFQ